MRKNRLEDFEAISEINVTPFVDVLLVLLVIFMITAPLFTKAIDVRLPQEKIKSSNVTEARKWVVAIDARGRYYLNGEKIDKKKLLIESRLWSERNPEKTVFIQADEKVPYGGVTRLMSLLKNADIDKIGLLVEDIHQKKP